MANTPHYEADPSAIDYKKEIITVKPRGLSIVWGKDPRYWAIPKVGDEKPAELLQVCWLEVTGVVDTDPEKSYEVDFSLSLTPDCFGWGGSPIYIMVKRGKDGKFSWTKDFLTNSNGENKFHQTCKWIKTDKENQGSTDKKLYFGLYEVWSGKWKGGLQIHNVKIREVKEQR